VLSRSDPAVRDATGGRPIVSFGGERAGSADGDRQLAREENSDVSMTVDFDAAASLAGAL